ncbi:MAG: RNase adapter RapZ [Rhodocyclaceae bacterium]|nr:RNase adapter RapZ [Rhodocyclaceae bacterium]
MQLYIISGLSGSGKSIALNVLEDAGFFCVDNLPALLLSELVAYLKSEGVARAGVAIDMRSGASVSALPPQLKRLAYAGIEARMLFLDARDDVLIARFSETRRRHPLALGEITLEEAIAREREALAPLSEHSHRIDTSDLRPNALRTLVKDFLGLAGTGLVLVFSSFGYKHGLPLDADLVFDVRCLPNPYYDPQLRPLTGCDAKVAEFLAQDAQVQKMFAHICRFLDEWLPAYAAENRAYLTVALGCTGGQHRSVWFAERLAERYRQQGFPAVLVRHRALAA